MKYIVRTLYAVVIALNSALVVMMLWKDWELGFWNQVMGQVVMIGVFIYWLIQFEKHEKRKQQLRAELHSLIEELKKTVLGELEEMHRLSRDKRVNRVLQKDTVPNEEGETNAKHLVNKRMQKVRSGTNKKVAGRKPRKTSRVSKQVLPKEDGDGSIK